MSSQWDPTLLFSCPPPSAFLLESVTISFRYNKYWAFIMYQAEVKKITISVPQRLRVLTHCLSPETPTSPAPQTDAAVTFQDILHIRWAQNSICNLSGSFRTLAEMSPWWGIRDLSAHVPCRLSRGCTCHAHTGILNSGWNSPGTYPTLSSSLSGHFSCFSWNDLSLPQLPIFPASSLSLCPSRSSSDSASLRELSPHPHP